MRELLVISNKKLRFGVIVTGLLMSLPILMLAVVIYFSSSLQRYKQTIINNTFLNDEGFTALGFMLFTFIEIIFIRLLVKPINNSTYHNVGRYNSNNLSTILHYPETTLKKALISPSWGRNFPTRYQYKKWIDSNRDVSPVAQWLIILISYLFIISHVFIIRILIKDKIIFSDFDFNLLLIGFIPFITTMWLLNKILFFIIELAELLISNFIRADFRIPEIIAFILFNYLYIATIIGIFYTIA